MKKLVAILIFVLTFGFIHAQKVQNLCSGTAPVKYTISGTSGMQYHWLASVGGNIINHSTSWDTVWITWPVKADTTHTLSVFGDFGIGSCNSETRSLSVHIAENPKLDLGGDTSICQGQSKKFTINGIDSVLWYNGDTSHNFFVNKTAKVWATIMDTLGCKASDTVNVTVNALPKVNLGPDVSICYGQSHTFGFDTINYKSIVWQDGSNDNFFIAYLPQTIIANVTDTNGCKAKDSALLLVKAPIIVNLGKDTLPSTCKEDIKLDAQIPGAKYLWSTSDTLQKVTVKSQEFEQWIKVKVFVNECSASDSVLILACQEIFNKDNLPNAFTPNGDEYNKYWELAGLTKNYPNAVVVVYDRWGRIVFTSQKGYPTPWDGTSKGVALPADNYFYIINLNVKGKDPIVGSVMIIK